MSRSRKRLDEAEIARQAIAYLVQTDLVLHWGFSEADPPSPEIMHLLMPYFADGEIELTTSELLCDYLVSRLREEYPSIEERSGVGRDLARARPALRVVCGDGDDD
jgi:hypothetical protein